MNPSVGVMPGMIFQVQGVDPGVFDPLGGSVILMMVLGGEGKGVQVGSRARQFHSGDCRYFAFQAKAFDVGSPVHDPVVFGGGGEFNVFGRQIDESIRGSANIVSAGGGVIVKVGAYPTGRFYAAGEGCFEIYEFALWHGDGFLDMVVLDAPGDDQLVLARVKSHGKLSLFGMVLVLASVRPIARTEFGVRRSFQPNELNLAGRRRSVLLLGLKTVSLIGRSSKCFSRRFARP